MVKVGALSKEKALEGLKLMFTARALADKYEAEKEVTKTYVHATSAGHEAAQLAISMHLKPQDYVFPYYRDDSILLGIGMTPYELMLQLHAKKDDPFSGGRTYYSHPSLNVADKPKIPHNSSATGMQAIPSAGVAMGLQYKELKGLADFHAGEAPVVVCSIGDSAMTEGEVSEAFHMAALKKLPIIFFVQDNGWDISANAEEVHFGTAMDYAKAFPTIEAHSFDGADFINCYEQFGKIVETVREERRPFMIHAKVPFLGHHTSGVRREWYRDDLDDHKKRDPLPRLQSTMLDHGVGIKEIAKVKDQARTLVLEDYDRALNAEEPSADSIFDHCYAPSPILEETGERSPKNGEVKLMVDCALFGVQELMEKHPEALFYGQDVGGRLGGVFREAATLAQKFGDDRVFNTPIQEAFIIGSTVGMSAVGLKPLVEVQFADYIWPGLNQLFTELSRSYYLSNGQWAASTLIRVPIGAYGSGGPYHSSSVESIVTNIQGIKVAYPSTGADLKGLMKGAFYDPNPVVMLEHKGLYWSKIAGTEEAKSVEPAEDYIIPLGKARVAQEATHKNSVTVITYGMGVYWAKTASKHIQDQVEIIDLRSLLPLDEEAILESVKKTNRCIVVTEEQQAMSFARGLAGTISEKCFKYLDAPVKTVGSENTVAIPLNKILEKAMLNNAEKVKTAIEETLHF
ncbi:MAG: thiamine pyrophosphate-dependent enzyme [Flavobacteriales bacterium]